MSLPVPYFQTDDVTLYCGDCLEILPYLGKVDAVVTDPPYLDRSDLFDPQTTINAITWCIKTCPSLVFWQANGPLPWMPDVVHIWHKSVPIHRGSVIGNVAGHHYERILGFHVGGCSKVYRVAAILPNFRACGDEIVQHPTQKPVALLDELLKKNTKDEQVVLDPYMGSGTTGVACVKTGRKFIGIELDPAYCEIAKQRIEKALSERGQAVA